MRNVGAFNFLLSDGGSGFVHRFGRSLFLLERRPNAEQPSSTRMPSWTPRRHAVLVASDRLTDEPWQELPEGTFLRVDRDPAPTIAWTG